MRRTAGQLDLYKARSCVDCGVEVFRVRFGPHTRFGWGALGGPAPLRCVECREQTAVVRAVAWKQANPDRVVQITRDRYLRKRDQMQAATARWRKKNPNKVRDIREARRARERNAFVEHVDRTVTWDAFEGCCGICGTYVPLEDMELDHIIPLSRDGLHEYANCQPAHMTCNRRKHNKVEGA